MTTTNFYPARPAGQSANLEAKIMLDYDEKMLEEVRTILANLTSFASLKNDAACTLCWNERPAAGTTSVEENNFDAALSYEIGHDLLLKNTLIIMKVQIINI